MVKYFTKMLSKILENGANISQKKCGSLKTLVSNPGARFRFYLTSVPVDLI